jgi:hypothetical protein
MIDFNFKELDIPTNVILLPEKPYQLFVSILMPEIKDDRIGSYNMNDKYLIKEHIAFIVAYNYAKAISKVHVDNVILTMNYLAHNLVIVYIVNKDIVTIYYSRGEGL